jgi:hypothetical protein
MTVTQFVTKLKGRVELAVFGPVRGPDPRGWHHLLGQQWPIAWLKHNVTTETPCCYSKRENYRCSKYCSDIPHWKAFRWMLEKLFSVWWDGTWSISVHVEGLGNGRDPSYSSADLIKPRLKSGCLVFAPKSERVTFQVKPNLQML